jgi:hypothetical protein
VIALLPAIWFGAHRLLASDATEAPEEQAPIPPVTSTASPAATTTTPPASRGPAELSSVAVSVPRRLRVAGLLDVGFDDSIKPRAGGFTAASTAEAARWESRGKPGSPGTDTVFLVGKVYRQSDSAFDRLPAVKKGAKISVRTDSGVLTYTVVSTASVPAKGLLSTGTLTRKVPGRLVLVGILFDARDDQRTGKYLVVVAQLSGARKS